MLVDDSTPELPVTYDRLVAIAKSLPRTSTCVPLAMVVTRESLMEPLMDILQVNPLQKAFGHWIALHEIQLFS